jgi:hypothetical protein
MKIRTWQLATAVALAVAAPLAAQSFSAGDDSWTTPSGGQTQVDLNDFPGALTALGSPVVSGSTVNLQGSPLNSSSIGQADTVLSRGAIASGSGSLTIAALNLTSSSNVVLQDGRQYSLQVCLSDTSQTAGTITLSPANGDGGTFNSSFTVLPKLVFTNVSNSSDKVRIDCGGGGCNPLSLSSSNTGWVQTGGPGNFSPSAKGIPGLPTGNVTVNNCDGTHTVGFSSNGHSGFYPGWTASSSSGFPSSGANEIKSAGNSWHKPNPPTDCATTSATPNGSARSRTSATIVKSFCLAQQQLQ